MNINETYIRTIAINMQISLNLKPSYIPYAINALYTWDSLRNWFQLKTFKVTFQPLLKNIKHIWYIFYALQSLGWKNCISCYTFSFTLKSINITFFSICYMRRLCAKENQTQKKIKWHFILWEFKTIRFCLDSWYHLKNEWQK